MNRPLVTLTKEHAETALRLLTAYANSGVPNDVSLECAQVCRVLRERLAQDNQHPGIKALNRHDDDADGAHAQAVREFWMPIIAPNGAIEEALVLAELSDYSHLLSEVPKVYSHVAGLSKTGYFASVIISEADRRQNEFAEECLAEFAANLIESIGEEHAEVICETATQFGVSAEQINHFVQQPQLAPEPTPDTCRLCGGAHGLHWPGCIVMAGAE